jgi:hypothetical protein
MAPQLARCDTIAEATAPAVGVTGAVWLVLIA